MSWIVLIPGLMSALIAFMLSPLRAFSWIYLTTLLWLPDSYRLISPGMPDPTFCQTAALTLMIIWLVKGMGTLRLSVTDALVLAFSLVCGWSQFQSLGYAAAQNYLFDILGRWLAPYFLARTFFSPESRAPLAKRMVILLACLLPTLLYDFRMKFNYLDHVIGSFFPDQTTGWAMQFRWGFGRAAGPFGHSILCGLVLMVGYFLHRFLMDTNEWNVRWTRKSVSAALLIGLAVTQSRGAWLGTIFGLSVLWLAQPGNRWRRAWILVVAICAVAIPVWIALGNYSGSWVAGAEESVNSVIYRKALMTSYLRIAFENPVLGWGVGQWPKVVGAPSIDNNYLLLALNHGMAGVLLFCALVVNIGVRLARFGLRTADRRESSFAFHLLAAIVGFSIALSTVYLGCQTQDIFFLLLGMSDRLLRAREPGRLEPVQPQRQRPRPEFDFKVVLR